MRILWLKTELLHPVDKGGKIRTYNMLKALKLDHNITYLTLDESPAGTDASVLADEYCHELVCVPHRTRTKFSAGFYLDLASNLVSPLPYFMKKYQSAAMTGEIASRCERSNFDVLVCDFLMPSVNIPDSVQTTTLLFQHNVEAMIWKRHYQVQSNPIKKVLLHEQWRKAVSYERVACGRFDVVAAVSPQDREVMRREYSLKNVEALGTGVDTEFFRRRSTVELGGNSLVFTGSMDWLPNDDAMRYFIEHILPLIKKERPDIKMTIAGRNPLPGLVRLGQRDSSITITGRVDDVRPYMQGASVYIIPLRIGGGTRLKVYEAMAMEMPIVSTNIGVEGLPVCKDSELLVADEPREFAAAVLRLLRDKTLARELGIRAGSLVRSRFSWKGVAHEFADLCQRAMRARHIKVGGAVAPDIGATVERSIDDIDILGGKPSQA